MSRETYLQYLNKPNLKRLSIEELKDLLTKPHVEPCIKSLIEEILKKRNVGR